MGGNPGLDNGDAFMRARREAYQAAADQQRLYMLQQRVLQQDYVLNPQLTPGAWTNPYDGGLGPTTPGERPEPEDVTGLKLLEKFLTKRRERDGKQRKSGD